MIMMMMGVRISISSRMQLTPNFSKVYIRVWWLSWSLTLIPQDVQSLSLCKVNEVDSKSLLCWLVWGGLLKHCHYCQSGIVFCSSISVSMCFKDERWSRCVRALLWSRWSCRCCCQIFSVSILYLAGHSNRDLFAYLVAFLAQSSWCASMYLHLVSEMGHSAINLLLFSAQLKPFTKLLVRARPCTVYGFVRGADDSRSHCAIGNSWGSFRCLGLSVQPTSM